MLKTFLSPLFMNVRNKLQFVPGKPFQPSLMFVDKAKVYPTEVQFECSTLG